MKTSIIIGLCLALLQSETILATKTPTLEITEILTNSSFPKTTDASTSTPPPPTTLEPSTEPPATIEPVSNTTAVPADKTQLVGKLSDRTRSILKHFYDPETNGFPFQAILTDPMTAPNTQINMVICASNLYNTTIHGLSNYTTIGVNLLLDEMQVHAMIRIEKILVKGNFTWESLVSTSKGSFNMMLTNVTVEGTVSLKLNSSGKLQADRSTSEMQYERLEVEINPSTKSLFQKILNEFGQMLLGILKPFILNEINQRLTEDVNKQLEKSLKMPEIAKGPPST